EKKKNNSKPKNEKFTQNVEHLNGNGLEITQKVVDTNNQANTSGQINSVDSQKQKSEETSTQKEEDI
ncbi:MAG: hypothetical protein JKX95_00890, partial [Bacteroidia bacterium]|nr:hypothetical protein [Bacteroidia bacterium]